MIFIKQKICIRLLEMLLLINNAITEIFYNFSSENPENSEIRHFIVDQDVI